MQGGRGNGGGDEPVERVGAGDDQRAVLDGDRKRAHLVQETRGQPLAQQRLGGITLRRCELQADGASGKTILPPYVIKRFDGIPVAFIGLTLRATPNIVSPAGVVGLEFKDEADTVNSLVPELKARGVEAIVVLIHATKDGTLV